MRRFSRHTSVRGCSALLVLVLATITYGQETTGVAPATPAEPAKASAFDKRVFGVLPNYRFAEGKAEFHPITAKQKFRIFFKDSTDWPVFPTALAFAGIYQLENQNPSFGQGAEGYAQRFGWAYTDQVVGNFFIEAAIPTMLHHDPRYFRRGAGAVPVRLGYAVSRLFVTRTDTGRNSLNVAELGGNSMQIAIANAYYPDTRTRVDNMHRLFLQLGTDGVSNVLKEFWPDIRHKFHRKHRETAQGL